MRHRLFRTAFLFAMLAPLSATATDDGALREACAASQPSSACRSYIAGFLDGALLTDTAVLDSLLEKEDRSAFFERAYRTRVGTTRVSPPATALAGFCLPETLSVDEAAARVDAALTAQPDVDVSLQAAVYDAVRRLFPCPANPP